LPFRVFLIVVAGAVTEVCGTPEGVSVSSAAACRSPVAERRLSELASLPTTAEIGFEVGFEVASTLPGSSLRSATSLVALALFVATVFGTGRAAVAFTVVAARGAGASTATVASLFPVPRSLSGSPASGLCSLG
jgi:hypothetical protein